MHMHMSAWLKIACETWNLLTMVLGLVSSKLWTDEFVNYTILPVGEGGRVY